MKLRRSLSQFISFSRRQYNFSPRYCKTRAEVAVADVKCRVSRNRKNVEKDITKYRSWTCFSHGALESHLNSLSLSFLFCCMLVLSHVWLCDAMDYSTGSSVHGNSPARLLEWVTISYPRGSSRPKDPICISCIGRQILLPLSYLESSFWAPKSLFPLKVLV